VRPPRPPQKNHYWRIPKVKNPARPTQQEIKAHLIWRRRLVEKCQRNPRFAAQIRYACKHDILFFVNFALWLKEPRNIEGDDDAEEVHRVIPWLTWPVQDWWFHEAEQSFGKENVLSPKCRAAGASWMVLALFLHRWLFFHNIDLGLASKNEEKVDSPDDPSSLFPKLDFLLKLLPDFLKPKNGFRRGPKRLINDDTRSTIIGYPSTGSLNRGGRNTAFFQDEPSDYPPGLDQSALESIRFVTRSQFIVGTLGSGQAAFNRIAFDEKWPGKRLPLPWTACPTMAAGMYTTDEHGRLKIIDETYPWARDENGNVLYDFILNPKKVNVPRSPYFDEASGGLSDAAIARELTCDPEASNQSRFDREMLRSLKAKHAQAWKRRGTLEFNNEDYEPTWVDDPNGNWFLWCELDENNKPPRDDAYTGGIDISMGTGASNSVATFGSRTTGKQVAVYVSAFDDVKRFAHICIAAAKFFRGEEQAAYLVPEANGGGTGYVFIEEFIRCGYGWALHRRTVDDEVGKKRSEKLGWFNPPNGGPDAVLTELIRALSTSKKPKDEEVYDCVICDADVYDELCQYIWKNNKCYHPGELNDDDESVGRNTHGDRAVSAALMWYGCRQRPRRVELVLESAPPPYSLAWFRQQNAAVRARGGTRYPDEAGIP
jgi:hypothetical protein